MGGPRIIGLTGDVGGGKSTVRAWLESRGAVGLDADRVVHSLLAGDPAVQAAVRGRFGASLAPPGQGVDRAALASVVFADPVALADLERIVHPAVRRAVDAWLASVQAAVAAVEGVKLIEAGMAAEVDQVWLVICNREVRRQRLAARGWAPAEVERRLRAATPLGPRLAVADVVIDNSGPWPATARQLDRAWAPFRSAVDTGLSGRAEPEGGARARLV